MPCRRYVARSLVAVVLVVSDNRIHVFHKERIPLLVPSQSREMIGNESAFMLPHIKHDDTIWKRFPHHYPFVKQIHRSPVDPPSKGPVMQGIDISLLLTRICCWTNNHVAGNLRRPCDATLSGVAWASQTTSKPILKFFVHIILAKLASESRPSVPPCRWPSFEPTWPQVRFQPSSLNDCMTSSWRSFLVTRR